MAMVPNLANEASPNSGHDFFSLPPAGENENSGALQFVGQNFEKLFPVRSHNSDREGSAEFAAEGLL
jgi:hypothetical protein